MQRGLIFWVLMLLWLVGMLYIAFGVYDAGPTRYYLVGGSVLHFILFSLLGWQVFGPAVKG